MDKQNTNYQNRDFIRTDESIISGETQKIKKFFKALAVLVVFFSSLSVPIFISYKTQMKAQEIRIKMDMGQIKNWATIYQLNNNNYYGLDRDSEINRVFEDIKLMDGDAHLFISKDFRKYCCQTNFLDKKLGKWCVDYSGNIGINGECDKVNTRCK
jgi:fructose-1,6-bisphosphatase